MTEQPNTVPTRSPSRRAVLKSGVLSTAGIVGVASGTASAAERGDRAGADRERESTPAERGALLAYQFRAERRFTVVESDLEWQPQHLDEGVGTHVVAYDRAPSLRAFVFTEPGEALQRGRSFTLERTRRPPAIGTDRRLVGVELEPVG
ncbi:hypothetical protein [Halosolutus gelatinilyticus]|uniref:hypothetical protein n=1 Tax=Halosolutus gelatinilyticus TaxID=2931975 RepID=UPI001FF699FE|nr:hypothetical protein [Halosolutus gelatinilyticus]